VIIPVRNEEETLPGVLRSLQRAPLQNAPLRRLVVADNGSGDQSAARAREAGAEVVHEPRRGYGRACLSALSHLEADPPDIVVFLDGDGSDDPADLPRLLAPLLEGRAEMVIGSRTLGRSEPGALNAAQQIGGWVAGWCLGLLFGRRHTDLGPFRAARYRALRQLGMSDPTWGWTVEMQARAARAGWRVIEIPVGYRRRRGGRSKISGSPLIAARAAARILWTLAKVAWSRRPDPTPHPDHGSSAV